VYGALGGACCLYGKQQVPHFLFIWLKNKNAMKKELVYESQILISIKL